MQLRRCQAPSRGPGESRRSAVATLGLVPPAPLYLIAVIKPDMAQAEAVAERLRIMRDATREEPGNVLMELVVGEDPDTWLMLEKFTSREAWEEHMTLPHVTEGNVYLADKLREPTELRLYSEK
ncbi:MAG: antibiotic biosynthesis monooxygenase [Actinobacteria bacterium]|nr:antibiotic biosynthesis monooxygenase [Actinomycetota bacterium]